MPAPGPYPTEASVRVSDLALRTSQRDWALGLAVELMNVIDHGWKWAAETRVNTVDICRYKLQEALDEHEQH